MPMQSMADAPAGMSDDPYSDGGMEADKPEEKPEGKDDGDSMEAVLPRGILGGKEFKVGDEVVLKVTGLHDDEITVKYATDKGDDESEKDVPHGTSDDMDGTEGMGKGDPEYD